MSQQYLIKPTSNRFDPQLPDFLEHVISQEDYIPLITAANAVLHHTKHAYKTALIFVIIASALFLLTFIFVTIFTVVLNSWIWNVTFLLIAFVCFALLLALNVYWNFRQRRNKVNELNKKMDELNIAHKDKVSFSIEESVKGSFLILVEIFGDEQIKDEI